jgi:multiple sugar transport system ATP-binding protein
MRIYEKPANLFVAGFLGSPAMNLLRGRVVRNGAARVDLRTASLPLADVPLPDGADVVVGVRPEDLEPTEGAPPGARIAATLELVEPVGNECFLNLDLDGQPLVARVPPRFAPEVGSRVEFAIDPGRLHYFDPRDGKRIDA